MVNSIDYVIYECRSFGPYGPETLGLYFVFGLYILPGRHGPAMILVLYWRDFYRHNKKSTQILQERYCWAFLN